MIGGNNLSIIPDRNLQKADKQDFWGFYGGDVSSRGLLDCGAVTTTLHGVTIQKTSTWNWLTDW